MVGDQGSTIPGWIEGAMMSAQHVVMQICGELPTAVAAVANAPDARRIVEGSL